MMMIGLTMIMILMIWKLLVVAAQIEFRILEVENKISESQQKLIEPKMFIWSNRMENEAFTK